MRLSFIDKRYSMGPPLAVYEEWQGAIPEIGATVSLWLPGESAHRQHTVIGVHWAISDAVPPAVGVMLQRNEGEQ
jgi:quinol-cytochrome oxidoreductase complex cytochrome b subunit